MRTIVSLLILSMLFTSSGHAAPPGARPIKIGIIGTGHIGGTLAKLWVAAGHEVLLSSRHPDELKALAAQLGPRARVGTPREAASFGDVVLVSVPYKALPELGRDLKAELAGKIVLDTCNPYPGRDGEMFPAALGGGALRGVGESARSSVGTLGRSARRRLRSPTRNLYPPPHGTWIFHRSSRAILWCAVGPSERRCRASSPAESPSRAYGTTPC